VRRSLFDDPENARCIFIGTICIFVTINGYPMLFLETDFPTDILHAENKAMILENRKVSFSNEQRYESRPGFLFRWTA
jgi:hypothetical protein